MILQYSPPSLRSQIALVIACVVRTFGIAAYRLLGRSRTFEVVQVRHIAMWLLRTAIDLRIGAIAALFHRSHSTVSYAISRIDAALESRLPQLRSLRRQVLDTLGRVREQILEAQYHPI